MRKRTHWFVPAVACLLAGLALAVDTSARGFAAALTQGLMEVYAGKFGDGARGRLAEWQKHVSTMQQSAPPGRNAMASANAFINRTPFVSDRKHWGTEDYWASPAETMASRGGDCEDYAIAKYFALKEIGVPLSQLRITYVKSIKLNQAHMVLAYYPTPDADPLILDNLEAEIRPASQRPDLVPVYSFNDEDVWLPGSVAPDGSASKVRRWNELLDKLDWEQQR